MDAPRLFVAACLALLLASAPALGEASVELDADGIWGNGPDDLPCIEVGGCYHVDVLLLGDISIRGFRISICNPSGCLDLLQSQYSIPAEWTTHSSTEGECIVFQAEEPVVTGVPGGSAASPGSWGSVKSKFHDRGDPLPKGETMNPLELPARVATLVFYAASNICYAPLTIAEAIYVDAGCGAGAFKENHGCVFWIQTCKDAATSYGSVKTLFR